MGISHLDEVGTDELAACDLVTVGSRVDPERMAQALGARVRVLLQFTDPEVFRFDHDPVVAHDVVFVGNWRGTFRRMV